MTHQDVIKLLELQRAVKELPSRYGFSNLGDFIRALEEFNRAARAPASGTESSTNLIESKTGPSETLNQAANNRRRKKRLSEDEKDRIVAYVNAGRKSAEIAKEMGCSLATVQNVKKAKQLVKRRAEKVNLQAKEQI